MTETLIRLPFEPTERQIEAAEACVDPTCRVVALDGAYRSGKTQAGGRVLFEWAMESPGQYLVARATYRSLKDSTQRALLHGDGGLAPLIPKEAQRGGDGYRASDEVVLLANGSEILFRSLEANQTEKLRGLTLAGALIDQVEELPDGADGERIWDTVLGRLSDPRGPRKLIAISNPAGLTHWYFRRVVDERTRDRGVRRVHFRMVDNPHLPADYIDEMLATQETRPHWYRSFVEGVWGAFAGQAYPEWEPTVHVVKPFDLPAHWERFESMDHGAANPTAWLFWACDEDGNVIVYAEHYKAGELVSWHAERIRELRERLYPGGADVRPTVFADPSTGAKFGVGNRWGEPATVKTEYAEHGVTLTGANNDRPAGYARLLELLHVEPGRIAPPWADVPARCGGAPRLYVFDTCTNLIAQFQSAPMEEDGTHAGNAVAAKWESQHGHAHAAARYGAISRPSVSVAPEKTLEELLLEPPPKVDLRQEALQRHLQRVHKPQTRAAYLTSH